MHNPILTEHSVKKQHLLMFSFIKIPPLKDVLVILTHFFYLSNL